jgi:hypothetical protein
MTLEEFFAGDDESRRLFDVFYDAVVSIHPADMKISKSQVAFRRKRAFAWAWIPGKYLHGKTAPLVLSVALRRRDASPRWKEIVEPRPGWFMHHLELHSSGEIDEQVRLWLREAWEAAG